MRQYNIQETKEVTKIICNKCGKEIAVENGNGKRRYAFCAETVGVFFGKGQ